MDTAQPVEKRFAFFGTAVAFAAHIRRPVDYQFKAVASSVIPVTGGLAEANADKETYRPANFDEDLITVAGASSRVSGDYIDPRRAVDFTYGNSGDNELSTVTLVETRVASFRVAVPNAGGAKTFEADDLLARIESTSDRKTPNSFGGLDAVFGSVKVNGNQLRVNTDTKPFIENNTLQKLANAYDQNSDFRKQHGSLFYPTGQEQTGIARLLWKPQLSDGFVLATVVTGFTWLTGPDAGKTIPGNKLLVDGIGTVFFGELVIEEGTRRLTLLRFQFGLPEPAKRVEEAAVAHATPTPTPPPTSGVGGEGSVCEAHSNGVPIPPQD